MYSTFLPQTFKEGAFHPDGGCYGDVAEYRAKPNRSTAGIAQIW